MKTKLILILGFLCFLFTAEAKVKSESQKMNLQSKVKSISEISYEAQDKFGEIVKGEKKREYSFDYDKLILFNQDANIIEKNSYESNGSIYQKSIYKYDNKGNLIESYWYKSDGTLETKITYTNNEKCDPSSKIGIILLGV